MAIINQQVSKKSLSDMGLVRIIDLKIVLEGTTFELLPLAEDSEILLGLGIVRKSRMTLYSSKNGETTITDFIEWLDDNIKKLTTPIFLFRPEYDLLQSFDGNVIERHIENFSLINDFKNKEDIWGHIREGANINDNIQKSVDSKQMLNDSRESFEGKINNWYNSVLNFLEVIGLYLEKHELIYSEPLPISYSGYPKSYGGFKHKLKTLVLIANKIESKIFTELEILKIDNFDNFNFVVNVSNSDVLDYAKDCFLEDDIKEAFLEIINEPYKEKDSGSETRDIFTDRLYYNGKRLSTVMMLKGRGQTGELTIKKSGSRGDQLLKLSKNYSAECFIVQHTNKIGTDVREALQDHILQNSRLKNVFVCFIDGVDTARILKGLGRDLESLKNKKSNPL